jgi:subtilisin family serine protease
VDLEHPAFQGRSIQTGSFRPQGTSPAVSRHGTSVLAILAGNPNSGTPGLAPDAHYFAADVYRAGDAGEPVSDTLSLLRAIDWMAASNVGLINMSLSGPNDELLRKAIVDVNSRGILFVAAAGNGGPNAPPSYPAAYPEVVAVTAVDRDLRSYIHANHGDYIDIAAPGVGIWTALPNALEGYVSGTSLAAPHATAILAALEGRVQEKTKSGYLGALVIRDLGASGYDRIYGRGLALAPAGCAAQPDNWIASVIAPPTISSAGYK